MKKRIRTIILATCLLMLTVSLSGCIEYNGREKILTKEEVVDILNQNYGETFVVLKAASFEFPDADSYSATHDRVVYTVKSEDTGIQFLCYSYLWQQDNGPIPILDLSVYNTYSDTYLATRITKYMEEQFAAKNIAYQKDAGGYLPGERSNYAIDVASEDKDRLLGEIAAALLGLKQELPYQYARATVGEDGVQREYPILHADVAIHLYYSESETNNYVLLNIWEFINETEATQMEQEMQTMIQKRIDLDAERANKK
ncbi:MAG: hypothetical protein PHO10_07940 [Gemmiger sp.]|nr:hypothetical protein [Gemmiger sp.]